MIFIELYCLPGEDEVLEGGRAVEGRPLAVHGEPAKERRPRRAGRKLRLVVEVLALHDAVGGKLQQFRFRQSNFPTECNQN